MKNKKRIENLQKSLDAVEVLLITDPIDIYYLTGHQLSEGRLMVTSQEATLYVDGRYFEAVSKESELSVELWEKESLKKVLNSCSLNYSTLLFVNSYSYALYESVKKHFSGQIQPINNPVTPLRLIKDEQEKQKMRLAAQLGSLGFDFIKSSLHKGVTEKQLSIELEIFYRRHGGEGCSFEPIIAFGENSSRPHYRSGNRALKEGDLVLIDIGVTLDHYQSDMTRVLFYETPLEKMVEVYEIVLGAQKAALKLCRAGVTPRILDGAARGYIAAKGYGEYFIHNLGHGIGLQVHEAPFLRGEGELADVPIPDGACITIEPGIYLPNIGGVRLEDTILITEDGYEDLTCREK